MDTKLDELVRARARNCCEYCRIPQVASKLTFPIDHIVARQHGGKSETGNLALCCGRCNQCKGPNIAGLDPETNRLTRLFNPRIDQWAEHFRYDGPVLVGLSDVGRTTVMVLNINHSYNVAARQALLDAGELEDEH